LVGSLRARVLWVPGWGLPLGAGPDALEEPAEAFAERLGDALTETDALSDAERSARNGLLNRQLTIR
ncbi:MAG: DUF5926 family protein, partial [Nocardioidaceae bacterium]